jgi:hypothetical protein
MRDVIESLSIGSGAILVAGSSAGIVWLLCLVSPKALWKIWAILVPFILAYCLYWSPVWLGADPSEYHAWALLFVVPWFAAGAIPSAAIVRILRKRRLEQNTQVREISK